MLSFLPPWGWKGKFSDWVCRPSFFECFVAAVFNNYIARLTREKKKRPSNVRVSTSMWGQSKNPYKVKTQKCNSLKTPASKTRKVLLPVQLFFLVATRFQIYKQSHLSLARRSSATDSVFCSFFAATLRRDNRSGTSDAVSNSCVAILACFYFFGGAINHKCINKGRRFRVSLFFRFTSSFCIEIWLVEATLIAELALSFSLRNLFHVWF